MWNDDSVHDHQIPTRMALKIKSVKYDGSRQSEEPIGSTHTRMLIAFVVDFQHAVGCCRHSWNEWQHKEQRNEKRKIAFQIPKPTSEKMNQHHGKACMVKRVHQTQRRHGHVINKYRESCFGHEQLTVGTKTKDRIMIHMTEQTGNYFSNAASPVPAINWKQNEEQNDTWQKQNNTCSNSRNIVPRHNSSVHTHNDVSALTSQTN